MSTKKYRAAQFKSLKHTQPSEYKPCIRLDTEHGETKRLSITVGELEAVMAVLQMIDDEGKK